MPGVEREGAAHPGQRPRQRHLRRVGPQKAEAHHQLSQPGRVRSSPDAGPVCCGTCPEPSRSPCIIRGHLVHNRWTVMRVLCLLAVYNRRVVHPHSDVGSICHLVPVSMHGRTCGRSQCAPTISPLMTRVSSSQAACGRRRPKRSSVLQWNPEVATQLIVGSDDDMAPALQLWDLRNSVSPLRELRGHRAGVLGLSWCPQDPAFLISSAKDNRRGIRHAPLQSCAEAQPCRSTLVHREVG